jgi:hypothetical protein
MSYAKPVRFTKGITNQPSFSPLGDFPIPSPLAAHIYINDFDDYTAGDWTVTATTGTTAKTAFNGGAVIQTTAATLNDIQSNVKNPASFTPVAGQGVWFMWRGQLSNAAGCTLQVGLQTGGTFLAPTDGIYFTKAAAATSVSLVIRASSVSTTVAIPTFAFADATNAMLAFYYDGNKVTAWASTSASTGVPVTNPGTANSPSVYTATTGTQTLTNFPTANLSVGFGLSASSATVRTMTTDYILAANEIIR